jgi:hypothetical protein
MGIEETGTKKTALAINYRNICRKSIWRGDCNGFNLALASDDSGAFQELPRLHVHNIGVFETIALGFWAGPRLDIGIWHLVEVGHDNRQRMREYERKR